MTNLTLGPHVRWLNGDAHETGRIVTLPYGAAITPSGCRYGFGDRNEKVLIALTYGGLAFVEYDRLSPVPARSEWEKQGAEKTGEVEINH